MDYTRKARDAIKNKMADLLFLSYILIAGIIAGGIAAISGFGIGSILTPLLSIKVGTKIAIAIVSLPHFLGTAIRFWVLRKNIDQKIFINFGISSIGGGLCGALLFWQTATPALTLIFSVILIFASLMEFSQGYPIKISRSVLVSDKQTPVSNGLRLSNVLEILMGQPWEFSGLLQKIRVGKILALIGGFISGFLGGLVGNQGGIRSAVLLSFTLDRKTFIATATAIGVIVDLARMPVYFFTQGEALLLGWRYILVASTGVIIGTGMGITFLKKISPALFRRIVASLVFLLGIFMLYRALT